MKCIHFLIPNIFYLGILVIKLLKHALADTLILHKNRDTNTQD